MQKEAMEQAALFSWAELMSCQYPELSLMYHVPNGGSRNKIEAAHLKEQGVKAGVPDIFLPVPRGRYHGFYIEMKSGKNKTSAEQERWLKALKGQGYATAVCYGWEKARDLIIKYLNLKQEVQGEIKTKVQPNSAAAEGYEP